MGIHLCLFMLCFDIMSYRECDLPVTLEFALLDMYGRRCQVLWQERVLPPTPLSWRMGSVTETDAAFLPRILTWEMGAAIVLTLFIFSRLFVVLFAQMPPGEAKTVCPVHGGSLLHSGRYGTFHVLGCISALFIQLDAWC
jgi:hypothetical protein